MVGNTLNMDRARETNAHEEYLHEITQVKQSKNTKDFQTNQNLITWKNNPNVVPKVDIQLKSVSPDRLRTSSVKYRGTTDKFQGVSGAYT